MASTEVEALRLTARLNRVMRQRRISPSELAVLAHVPLSVVQKLCWGKSPRPSVFTIAALAKTLDVSIDALVYGEKKTP